MVSGEADKVIFLRSLTKLVYTVFVYSRDIDLLAVGGWGTTRHFVTICAYSFLIAAGSGGRGAISMFFACAQCRRQEKPSEPK